MPTIIIFDQLFWKASEIVNAVPDDGPVRNVVVLLDGSGRKETQGTVTGENATVHTMSRTAVQQAFRGHLLVISGLHVTLAKFMEDDPGFQDKVKELEKLYTLMAIGENDLESSLQSDCICQIDKAYLHSNRNELAWISKTSTLLINYQRMVGIA